MHQETMEHFYSPKPKLEMFLLGTMLDAACILKPFQKAVEAMVKHVNDASGDEYCNILCALLKNTEQCDEKAKKNYK